MTRKIERLGEFFFNAPQALKDGSFGRLAEMEKKNK